MNEIFVSFSLVGFIYLYYPILFNKLKTSYPHYYSKINNFMNKYFLCISNIVSNNVKNDETNSIENEKNEGNNTSVNSETIVSFVDELYENKYLKKFKTFPNEFIFTEEEMNLENDKFVSLKIDYETKRFEELNEVQQTINQINDVIQAGGITTNEGIVQLVKFFNLGEEYEEDPDEVDLNEYMESMLVVKQKCEKTLENLNENVLTDDDLKKKAYDYKIEKKLSCYINNYISETTPLGNVYMRYNNDKGSFEYFSNYSIPYRYLEPMGRKYVMTYWCKPIFVNLEEELKRAEERFEEDKKKAEEEINKMTEMEKNNPKNIIAKLKGYNKSTVKDTLNNAQGKNRNQQNFVLPPQIKANLPNVNQTSSKQLLKEKANRYTWEGRFTNFSPLKKINRKKMDKKLTMNFSDFKRMQQEQQNKK